MHLRILVVLGLSSALFAGCVTTERKKAAPSSGAIVTQEEPDFAAKFAATPGAPRIRLSLGDQRAYYTKGDTLIGSTRISTGKPGHSTPRGSYRVTEKVLHYVSRTYGQVVDASGETVNHDADSRTASVPEGGRFVGAPMPFFMRFNGGIGMHAGYVPNYPASHGCVRLPRKMAEIFYENTPIGTPVVVGD